MEQSNIPSLQGHYPEARAYLDREARRTYERLRGARRVAYSSVGDAGIQAGVYNSADLLDLSVSAGCCMARVIFDGQDGPEWMDGRLLIKLS